MQEILIFSAGLILFLFGMMKLGEQVQQFLSVRVRQTVRYAVQTVSSGMLTGAVSTILFQSSSTTMVITIGMVSAGIISFQQSLAVILGADIGTVLTVQLVVWKVTDLSPVLLIAGGVMRLAGDERRRPAGEAIFYFGLIFFGLSLATLATAPLKQHPDVIGFLQQASHPLMGFGIGILFTGLIHASVITISLLVILAQQGLIGLDGALPVVFGANIGTTVTALMAGALSGISGRRTAASHLIFKCTGAMICLLALPVISSFLKQAIAGTAQQIVLGHLLYNVLIAVLFFPFLKLFARLMERLMPGRDATLPLWPEYLDEKALSTPEAALENVRKEMKREILLAQRMVRDSQSLIHRFDKTKRRDLVYLEIVVNYLKTAMMLYLRKISCNELSAPLDRRLFAYTAMADNIQRIGSHAVTVASLSRDRHRRHVPFSDAALADLSVIEATILENLQDAASLIERRDTTLIRKVHRHEDEVDRLVKDAQEGHLIRFHQGLCQDEAGPIFIELLIHLERISDLCQNIAEYVDDLKEGNPADLLP